MLEEKSKAGGGFVDRLGIESVLFGVCWAGSDEGNWKLVIFGETILSGIVFLAVFCTWVS